MEFRTSQGPTRYADLVRHASGALVGLDFDGTLAPIVDDPAAAVVHPDAPAVLVSLARVVRQVAIVTGRPASQVVSLGRLDTVARSLGAQGLVTVAGQYGNESWRSDTGRFETRPAPEGLAGFAEELPRVLADTDAAGALVEDKRIALAVHTRGLADPPGALERLAGPLDELAARHGLHVEPGRLVIEIREPGMTKGRALTAIVQECAAQAMVYVGDDIADLDAFEAVEEMRASGIPGLLVCSASDEEQALVTRSDLVVDGPGGVVAFLRRLAAGAVEAG